jgi:hypothetical protein
MVEGLVVAILAGGLVAGAGFQYAAWQFLKRWLVAVVLLFALFWGGAR